MIAHAEISHRAKPPFPLPARLPASLARVRGYWAGLRRGEARVPFWDDFRPGDLADLAGTLLLIDVFERPPRYRLNSVGSDLAAQPLEGRFLDEIEPRPPFDFLASQCGATVEAAAPTFFSGVPDRSRTAGYRRLLLPMWGDGRIGMILAAVDLG